MTAYLKILSETTPKKMLEVKYDRAKSICFDMWDKPKYYFEDVLHDTMMKCLETLGDKEYSQDYLKNYFFKAFRINMIRNFGYAYNKLKSGHEINDSLLIHKDNILTRMDGYSMLEYVENKHGSELKQMLWDNLSGLTYSELNKKYNVNTWRYLSKIKDELKQIYNTDYYASKCLKRKYEYCK